MPLPVFGTGVLSTNPPKLLSTAPPSGGGTTAIDPHFTLVSAPAGVTLGKAYVLNSSATALSNNGGAYVADSTTSEWISPDPAGNPVNYPRGYYWYQTTFVMPAGCYLQTAVLTGDWAVGGVDAGILLNGSQVMSPGAFIPYTSPDPSTRCTTSRSPTRVRAAVVTSLLRPSRS